MTSENERPWHKNLLYICIISATLAVIIGAILIPSLNPPPADFSISINPMQGAIEQGGIITSAITVRGIQGYEYPVNLSAIEQPSGVVVTFYPLSSIPTPSYTSTATISVGQNVPVDEYEITIKGIGADGKEHICSYSLIVRGTVTPTPSTYLIIQKFEDTNRNALTDSNDERLQGEEFVLTDPDGKTTAYATDDMGEIRIAIPREYEGNDYTVEEIVKSGWVPVLPIKQRVNVPKGKTTTIDFLNARAAAAGLLIQMFNDANLNDKIESSDERLTGWEFKVTDPGGKITTCLTDASGGITLVVPPEYEGKEYIVEETLLPGWEPVLPIKQTVKVLKGEEITVQFLNRYQPEPESIKLGMYLPDHQSPSFSLYGGNVLNVSVAWNITPTTNLKLAVNLMESETDFTRLSESDAIKIVSGSGKETFKLKVKPTTEIHDRAVISASLSYGNEPRDIASLYRVVSPNEVTIIDYSPDPVYAGEELNVKVGWNNIPSDWNLVGSLEESETDYTRLAESDAKKTVSGSGEEIFKLKVKPTTEIHNQAKVCVALYDEKGEALNIFEKEEIDVLPPDIP